MDSLLSCATGRYRPAEKRSPLTTLSYATTSAKMPLPPQLGETCIAGWFLKSPKDKDGRHKSGGAWLSEMLLRQRRLRPWRRRYFVLTQHQSQTVADPPCYQLYYYADASRAMPAGAIDISSVCRIGTLIPPPVRLASTLSPELRAGLQLQKPFVSFEGRKVAASLNSDAIAGERRRFFYLLADSREDMMSWAEQLELATTAASGIASSAASGGAYDEPDGPLSTAGEATSTVSRPDSGFGGGGSCGGFGGSLESVRTVAETASGVEDEPRSPISQQQQHPNLRLPNYATLDISAIRQPRSTPADARPLAGRAGLEYREVDTRRTLALAEIGADFAKRSRTS